MKNTNMLITTLPRVIGAILNVLDGIFTSRHQAKEVSNSNCMKTTIKLANL